MMEDVFPFLVSQAWQVAVLAVVVWGVVKTCCKRRPHLAHALWLLVLIKCLVPPVFSSSAGVYSWLLKDRKPVPATIVDEREQSPTRSAEPAFVKGLFPEESQNRFAKSDPSVSFTPIRKPRAEKATLGSRVAKAFEMPTTNAERSSRIPQVATKPAVSLSREPKQAKVTPILTEVSTFAETRSWQYWISLIWLAGCFVCVAVTLVRFLMFRKWIRKQETIECQQIEAHVNELAARLKLRRKIRVSVIDAEFGPAIMGLLRPTIVLPQSLVAEKTPEELEPMLAHELIHFRRGDTCWAVLQVIACSVMWFHPLVWLASRKVTRESERCCDEETIANFECDRANYARMLVDVLEQKSRLRIAPVAPGVRPADVTSSRLERIMQSDNGNCRRTPRWVWALALLIAIAVLPGAAMVQSQETDVTGASDAPTRDGSVEYSRWQLASERVQKLGNRSMMSPVRKDKSIYLGIPVSAVKTLRQHGKIAAPIQNSEINRIVISDRNVPKSGKTKHIEAVLRGDQLVFEFSTEQLEQITEYSFECKVKSEHLGKYRSALIEYSPALNRLAESAFGDFNPEKAKVQFASKIREMVKSEEEQKKVMEELKDEVWQSHDARMCLLHCKKPQVDLEIRVAKVPRSLVAKTALVGKDLSEQQIQKFVVGELVELIRKTNDAEISPVTTKSLHAGSNFGQSASAKFLHSTVAGVRGFSILDSASLEPLVQENWEGVTFSFSVSKADGISTSLVGQLEFQNLEVSAARKLPLKLGSNEIKVESVTPTRLLVDCEWDLPEDKAQVIFGRANEKNDSRMIVIVESSRKPPLVGKDKDLTLERVLKIKDGLTSESPVVPMVSSESTSEEIVSTQSAKTSNPISLVLQCGKVNEEKSLNTKIGLGGKGSLTIEGEVDSQQISTDSVQVSGKDFVFNNKKEDWFKAKAGIGSVSFKRGEPIENSLRLSLKDNAILQFAGIEFEANIIECSPNRVEAIRGASCVTVKIPEINSSVSADRVVMNLKTLAFDFEGNVVVKRDIGENSFPMLVKGNHVVWSLVIGHLEMRDGSPNRSPQQLGRSGISNVGASINYGNSVFERQLTRTRSGFAPGGTQTIAQPNQTNGSRFNFQPQTQNGN